MTSTLLIIDAMNLIRRIYAVQEKQHGATQQALTATQTTATNALKKLLQMHQPTHAICVFDSHAKSWRHQLYGEYKQGRKPIPSLLKEGLNHIQDQFFNIGVDSLVTETDEADDLIATLANKMAIQKQKAIIISTDKGFYQLLNEHIIIYDYFQKVYTDAQRVKNKMSLSCSQLCDYWAICGVTGSAIKGVEGVGSKGALTLLQTYSSLDKILLESNTTQDKRVQKVLQSIAKAKLAKQLVTLQSNLTLGFNLHDLRYREIV